MVLDDVLLALQTLCKETGRQPTYEEIAEEAGTSKSSVQTALASLEAKGDVIRVDRTRPSKRKGAKARVHTMRYTAKDYLQIMSQEGSLLWRDWENKLIPGGDWEDALKWCEEHDSPKSELASSYYRAHNAVERRKEKARQQAGGRAVTKRKAGQ